MTKEEQLQDLLNSPWNWFVDSRALMGGEVVRGYYNLKRARAHPTKRNLKVLQILAKRNLI